MFFFIVIFLLLKIQWIALHTHKMIMIKNYLYGNALKMDVNLKSIKLSNFATLFIKF